MLAKKREGSPLGASRSQVNKSCQVIPRPTTSSPVDLFLFSRHTGDCWTSGLCVAKIAAKIKHAWLLEACPSSWFVLYSPLRRWPFPILEGLGHFSKALVPFTVKLAPPTASRDAGWVHPLSPLGPKLSPMAFPVTRCQLCTRRREHTARPGTLQTRQP